MTTAILTVSRVHGRARHGGFAAIGATRYYANGSRQNSHARAFACACGEQLRDGDPCIVDPATDRTLPIHWECRREHGGAR